MFHKYVKLVLATGVLAWAVQQFIEGNIMNGISLVLLAGIFVLFYYKNEFILLVHEFPNATIPSQCQTVSKNKTLFISFFHNK